MGSPVSDDSNKPLLFDSNPSDVNEDESDSDFADVDVSAFMAKFAKKPIEPQPVVEPELKKPDSNKPSIGDRARAISASLGISFRPGRDSTRKIPVGTEDVQIANNTRNLRAMAPSAEAIDAKDQLVALGREIIDQAHDEHVADLRANGSIPEGGELSDFRESLEKDMEVALEAYNNGEYTVSSIVSLINGEIKSNIQNASDDDLNSLLAELAKKFNLKQLTEPGLLEKIKADKEYELRITIPEVPSWSDSQDSDEAKAAYAEAMDAKYAVYDAIDRVREYLNGNALKIGTSVEGYKEKGDREKTRDMETIRLTRGGHSFSMWDGAVPLRSILEAAILRKNSESLKKIRDAAERRQKLADVALDAKRLVQDFNKNFHSGIRDKMMRIMKENGFEFDSVSIEDFKGRIRTPSGAAIKNTQSIGRELEQAFEFMPKNVILGLLDWLEQKGKYLNVRDSKARGHFNYSGGGSKLSGPLIRTNNADVLLHELWHFVQYVNRDVATLENAYIFGRAADKNGNMPTIGTIFGYADELGFKVDGISHEYMAKQYADNGVFFDAKNWATEVSTMGMQDLFTNGGKYSTPTGKTAIVGQKRGKKVYKDPYKDPATGIWYTDSTKTERIDPRTVYGRAKSEGIDFDMKAFNIGLLLALFDWGKN